MSATAQPTRRLDIQGLRAVAVLMVVGFHAGGLVPGGFVGVDVFFVISGFVITAMLQREWETHGRIRFGRFYLRRFKRLAPALALPVLITMLVGLLVLSPIGGIPGAAQTGIGALLFVANLVLGRGAGDYFASAAERNPLLNTWSLSVEEQFYLLFPALLALLWWSASKGRDRSRWPAIAIALLIAASFAATFVPGPAHDGSPALLLFGFYGPLPRVWEFGVGALLALTVRPGRLSQPAARTMGWVGLAGIAASLWLITGETPFPGPWTILPVAATALLLVAGAMPGGFINRWLASTPMVKVGDWSYSIYLWHWPLIVFARILTDGSTVAMMVAAVVSFVPAWASYRFVEEPIRRRNLPTRLSVATLVAATMVVPLAVTGGIGYASTQGFWSDTVRTFRHAGDHHLGLTTGCAYHWDFPAQCIYNAGAVGAPVYLVGDSVAEHLVEGLVTAAKGLDRPVQLQTQPGCPFVDVVSDQDPGMQCDEFRAGAMAALLSARPGTVIISNSDSTWLDPDTGYGQDAASLVSTPDEKRGVLSAALGRTVTRLEAAGHHVILAQSTPRWGRDGNEGDPLECSVVRVAVGGCATTRPETDVLAVQGSIRQVIESAAKAHAVTLFDPWHLVCRDGVCSSVQDGTFLYRDAVHLSVSASELLAPDLRAALVSADR